MEIKIIGNLTPEVGIAEKYTVEKVLEAFDTEPLTLIPEHTDAEITWSIYVLDANVWRLAKGREQKGKSVEYKFSEISLKFKDIAMIVEAYGKETMIHIKPQPTSQPKITFIELLDENKKTPKKSFTYGNWIITRVHCVGMELRPIVVTLVENDGDKHKLNTKNLKIDTQKKFVKRGFADIKFYLDPMHTNLANSKADKGESDEGKFHEYYVTAEIAGKEESRRATLDTHVANPDYVEKKLVVSPTIGFPVREVINSLMMVDMDPQTWWPFKETHGKCKNCEKDITLNDIENAFGTYINHKIARQEIVKYINEFVKLSKEKGKPIHLDTCLRKAHFFAQIGTETLGINPYWMVETDAKRYSVVNCKTVFGDRAKHLENAGLLDDYCSDNPQKRLLNYVYGKGNGFDNGNGNEASGDGYKFRGRGLKQLTGRGNYKDASKILKDVFPEHYIDLEANPDKVKEPKYAVLTAFAFWEKHEIWKVADSLKESTDDNIKKIRSKINPGLAGWRECKKYFEKGLEVFKVNKCQPVDGTQEDNGKWRFPIDNPMLCMYSQGGLLKPWHGSFGKNIRDELANHTGNDLLAEPGTKVYACVRSKVEKIYTSSSLAGKVVVLKVLDVETFKSLRNENYLPKYKNKGEILEKGFDPDGDLYLTFWHLSKNNFFNIGDEVEYDDIIGLTGISGWNGINFSTRNPHLHFEVSNVGSAPGLEGKCNPSVYFKFKTEDELSQNEINFQNRLKEKEWK